MPSAAMALKPGSGPPYAGRREAFCGYAGDFMPYGEKTFTPVPLSQRCLPIFQNRTKVAHLDTRVG
jgi:hypothetical protein